MQVHAGEEQITRIVQRAPETGDGGFHLMSSLCSNCSMCDTPFRHATSLAEAFGDSEAWDAPDLALPHNLVCFGASLTRL